jgi:hypothetical protein
LIGQYKDIRSPTFLPIDPCLLIAALTAATRRGLTTAQSSDRNKLHVLSKQLKQQLQNKDVILYEAPTSARRTFFFMYISAGVQLLFW